MKKVLVIFGLVFGLAACDAGPEEQKFDMEKVQSVLPEGCTLHYAGTVRVEGFPTDRPSRVFVTTCGNTVTTSQTNSRQNGKTTVDEDTVSVVTSQ